MKTVAVFMVLLFASVGFSQVSDMGCLSCRNENRATQMMASHYTHKPVGDISAFGAVITVSTTWPGYLISGIYNPRRDSSAWVHCISQAGDTARYSIPTESPLGTKPPPLSKIITATSTDSLIFIVQLLKPQ
jgi:hypothetical protein